MVWYILDTMRRDTSKYLQKINLNPEGKDVSDCSTRSICYCLGLDYGIVRSLQDNISQTLTGSKSAWNTHPCFEPILLCRNWVKILLKKRVPRYRLATILSGKVKIFTESYSHVAPIHNGKVIDTWDSTRGLVSSMIVPLENLKNICRKLDSNSLEYIVD